MRPEPIKTSELEGFRCEIHYDPDPDTDASNPRQWDNLGTLVCWHSRRQGLGDKYVHRDPAAITALLDEAAPKKERILLAVYAYDHGGISLSAQPFSDPWDSGQVGIIFCTKAKAKDYWPNLRGEKLIEAAETAMRQEIVVYDDWLYGRIYGYVIRDLAGEEVDSCWGIVGDLEYAEAEGQRQLEYFAKKAATRNAIAAVAGF